MDKGEIMNTVKETTLHPDGNEGVDLYPKTNINQVQELPQKLTSVENQINQLNNGKLTKPTNPSAESAVTMLADGTVGTKPLSEIGGGGGGKLYLHDVPLKKSDYAITVYITFYSSSDQSTSDSKLIDIIQKNGLLFQGSNNMGVPIAGVLLPTNENNFDSCDFSGINLVTGQTVEATGAKFIKQNEIIMEM